jgi:hypothetical protein
MGREEDGGSSACRNSGEGRAPEGPHYAGGSRTLRRGDDEETPDFETDGGASKKAGPESGMK